ncbi:MAG: 4-(cytidine 5'-diphospho)-2-C-methyl-D-erythritol kinase [Methyloceanibacter sp.]
MTALRDIAWAKVNLTLRVLGRRADGFHELESLIAFVGLGDSVELTPGEGLDLVVEGPFAGALGRDNLILKAAEAAKAAAPVLRLGRFRLVKILPVAAGIGGGSADAAAALRLLVRAGNGAFTEGAAAALASALGSDVSVCLGSRPALVTGRGERVEPIIGFPACALLLANPALPLATTDVYRALEAEPMASPPATAGLGGFAGDFDRLLAYLKSRRNDLESPALCLAPAVGDVLDTLRALPGARVARMSGSGPTCFALFATTREAQGAATALAQAQPGWWIAAGSLGSPQL